MLTARLFSFVLYVMPMIDRILVSNKQRTFLVSNTTLLADLIEACLYNNNGML